jgi:hypothetical protein
MDRFTAYRRDGKIIIELDEGQFLQDAVRNDADELSITERDRFLEFALNNVFTLTHDVNEIDQRTSWWLRLTQALGKAAAANGEGVRRTEAAVPTCGCDPEEHDGG